MVTRFKDSPVKSILKFFYFEIKTVAPPTLTLMFMQCYGVKKLQLTKEGLNVPYVFKSKYSLQQNCYNLAKTLYLPIIFNFTLTSNLIG